MEKSQYKTEKRSVRHNRIRAKVSGTTERPRLSVFRSNRFVYAQIIDDTTGKTLASSDTRSLKSGTATEKATIIGTEIAKKAKAVGINSIVFDRGGFRYQGAIASLADSARAGGLEF